MTKRWHETQRCLGVLRESLDAGWVVRAKQLCQDREEITVAVFRAG